MLRRTTAKQVSRVYPIFVEKYSEPAQLSRAPLSELEDALKSLGMHNVRARQLKALSIVLIDEHNGFVPTDYEELVALPGVGSYIANAVLCFAFHHRVPMVDSNVTRIYRRAYGDDQLTHEHIMRLVSDDLPEKRFIEYNRALLDLASLTCRAINPQCGICPLSSACQYPSHS